MCGILAALGLAGSPEAHRRAVLRAAKLLRHRGPDASSCWQSPDGAHALAFERLQIIDVTDGGKCVPVARTRGGGPGPGTWAQPARNWQILVASQPRFGGVQSGLERAGAVLAILVVGGP